MCQIKTEKFQLDFTPEIFDGDKSPVNATLHVEVKSYDFAARADMDINSNDFKEFCHGIRQMYETLSGSAEIGELYGTKMNIKFTVSAKGTIKVSGYLSAMYDEGQHDFRFENSFDQTCLRDFALGLYNKFGGMS